MRATRARLFQSLRPLLHENPLGLPRSGTPPSWPKKVVRRRIPGVGKVVAVSSAKGGVGKSTIAANLSMAYAKLGYRAGILDTDIFGPSIPTLFRLTDNPRLSGQNQLVPLVNYGVKTMSMGYLVDEKAPIVWRGPMVMKAIQQLLHEVEWGGLDILILDLPPGTGDTQLTITQQIFLDGAVIVTTPHTLATKDALKGINMFEIVDVPIIGLIQNMSLFQCPNCHKATHIFGSNERVYTLCDQKNINFLGDIPLHPRISDDASRGKPTMAAEPESERASAFINLAQQIGQKITL
ncbi:hypothetical protein HIM_08959 [Hirsutella minnesotensis 3608]|uniref:Iron-sulfur protein IND1 n=1 Tax=Hirsutella minnesotensis 3608 TaxID=1043627 RepID=A0A0F7ZY08_9HYPO|nr:hypothetical protein HIM_08959 [Hirsutella minnesotensis 3608]